MSRYKLLLSANSGLYSARPGMPRVSMLQAVDFLAQMGFEGMDVNFSGTILTGEFVHEPVLDGDDWRERLAEIRERAERKGLRIVHSHAPYHHKYVRESPDYPLCEEMMRRSIEGTALLGGSHIVVHPLVTPNRTATLVEETVRAVEPLARYGEQFGVRLAVENMRSTRPETLAEIADRAGADVCWDVGHAHIFGLNQEVSLKTLGTRVKVLHIHDNYGPRGGSPAPEGPTFCDLHQPPFLGTVDWDSFLRGLDQIGFAGAFNYEVPATQLPLPLREAYARYLVHAAEELLAKLARCG